jgi:hypothetical protein
MPQERRLTIRKTPKHLAYLSLPFNNGGIVVDVSEGGLGFRSIAPVEADGPIHFRFAIDSGKRIKAVGELAWKDETGKIGGLRFTQLSDETREQIRAWASDTNTEANAEANALADANALDVRRAEPATEDEFAHPGNDDLAPGEGASRPLLYNLKPPIYSAPFNSLSMFPLGLNSEAAATAAVPQFVQLLDEIREQVRDWVGQSTAGVYDDPFADPAFEAEVAPRSETDLALAGIIPIVESAIEPEDVPDSEAELATALDARGTEPAIEDGAASSSESDFERIVAAGNPFLYNLKPPVYSAPFNPLSMFPVDPDSETAPADVAVPQSVVLPATSAVPAPIVMRHPIAAIGVTIVLAFVVSMGIIAYLSTSHAGKLLLDWGDEMWDGPYSQPISRDAAPPASRAQGSSSPLRQ